MIYIKIKHLKNFLMIVACLFLASFNYFTYAETTSENTATTNACDKAIDSDCDGLTNSEEKLYGTDLANADTDGDSYSDMVEIESSYDPLKPAPGDKILAATNAAPELDPANAEGTENTSVTENFSQELIELIQEEDQTVTKEEVMSLVDEQIGLNMQKNITFDNLPEIDQAQIKILKQDYSSLDSKERAEKEARDAIKYLNDVFYLLVNNSPVQFAAAEDFSAFYEEFSSHLADLSDPNNDSEYLSDLGERLKIFSNQINDVQVPETMVNLHIKFLRIIKGFLTLQDSPETAGDPLARAILLVKAKGYTELMLSFMQNDLLRYFQQLASTN